MFELKLKIMALRMNLFKVPKHKRYEYTPRYFNPNKEELNKRVENAKVMAQNDPEGAKARIASRFKRGAGDTKTFELQRKKAVYRQNMLLVFLIIVLIFAAYFLVEFYVPDFLEKLE